MKWRPEASGREARVWALSALAGWAQAAAMATPWSGRPLWWLQGMALCVLCALLLRAHHWKQGVAIGWAFGLSWLGGTFWWLFIAMHTYGGLMAPLAVLAVFLLAAALASYYAVACGLFVAFPQAGVGASALFFGALWLGAELARGRWWTGFGWGATGYAHLEGPLSAHVPWAGAYGVAWLAATLAMALVGSGWRAWRGRKAAGRGLLAAGLTVCGAIGLPWLYTHFSGGFTQPHGAVQVALLQGNIAQDIKFQPGEGVGMSMRWYSEQLGAKPASLVIAPETAIPLLPSQWPAGFGQALQDRYGSGEQAALVGVPLGSADEGYTNSVMGLKPGQHSPWRYDKHHLVPFGEFIPPFFRWFTELMQIPLGDFNRGALGQASFEWQGQRWAPNICYEDLFGEELGARFRDPAQAPTVFVNLSNIAWFGDTLAIDQHWNISRMRALEFERPFVRATNTGATGIMDHQGRAVAQLPRLTRGVLVGEVTGRTGLTPYAWWVSRWGLWPLWALVILTVWWAIARAIPPKISRLC